MLKRFLPAWLQIGWTTPAPRLEDDPLPPALRARLGAIPEQELLCRDVDGLWAPWLAGRLAGKPEESQVREHLEGCRRCRSLCGVLAEARQDVQPLPATLAVRLRGLTDTRPALPWWIADTRFAVAACYLLAACVALMAGAAAGWPAMADLLDTATASPKTRQTLERSLAAVGDGVHRRAQRAMEAGSRLGHEMERVSSDLTSDLRTGLERTAPVLDLKNLNPDLNETTPGGSGRPINDER